MVEFDVDDPEAAFGGLEFSGDAGLLALEELEWHGVGVMGFEQLAAFVLEGADPSLLDQAFLFGEVPLVGEVLFERVAELFNQVPSRRDGGVVLLDQPLDVFDPDGFLGAVGAALLAADADEVRKRNIYLRMIVHCAANLVGVVLMLALVLGLA